METPKTSPILVKTLKSLTLVCEIAVDHPEKMDNNDVAFCNSMKKEAHTLIWNQKETDTVPIPLNILSGLHTVCKTAVDDRENMEGNNAAFCDLMKKKIEKIQNQ